MGRPKKEVALAKAELEKPTKPTKTLTSNPRLRLDAGLRYMTHPEGVTVERLHTEEQFKKVSLSTLESWCKEDRWVERRSAFLEKWRDLAAEKIGSQLMQQRQVEYGDLKKIHSIGMELIQDIAMNPPKSWEGVVKAVVDASRYARELESSIATEIMPGSAPAARVVAPADVNLSPDELQIAAREILRHRRETLKVSAGLSGGEVIDVGVPIATPADAGASEGEEEEIIDDG